MQDLVKRKKLFSPIRKSKKQFHKQKYRLIDFYKTSRPGLHAFRATTGAAAIIALFIGLRELPLADVVSLTFGGPIFVTVASIFFLSEKVGIKRWSAVFLGFIGMLLIVQPAFIDLNFYYITPIIFCIFFACVAISVRSLSKTEPNYRIAFYFTRCNTRANKSMARTRRKMVGR